MFRAFRFLENQIASKLNYVFWKEAAQTVLERLVVEHTETADSRVNVKIRYCYDLIVRIYVILR